MALPAGADGTRRASYIPFKRTDAAAASTAVFPPWTGGSHDSFEARHHVYGLFTRHLPESSSTPAGKGALIPPTVRRRKRRLRDSDDSRPIWVDSSGKEKERSIGFGRKYWIMTTNKGFLLRQIWVGSLAGQLPGCVPELLRGSLSPPATGRSSRCLFRAACAAGDPEMLPSLLLALIKWQAVFLSAHASGKLVLCVPTGYDGL